MSWFRAISGLEGTFEDVYVSTSGDFANDGSSPAEAMDVAKLETLTLAEKTRLLFKKGEVFEIGSFDFDSVGGKITQYGSGERAKLIGGEDISGNTWTDTGGNIYSTPVASTFKWLFVGGVAATLAQSAWIPSTAIVSSTVIRGNSATLNAFSSLVGAKIRIFVLPWLMGKELTISSYDSGTGNITVNESYWDFGEPAVGVYFTIYNQLQFVTDNNEFFFNSGTNVLYYKSAVNPSTLDIKAGNHDTGINLVGDNISILGVEIAQYNYGIQSAQDDSSNIHLKDVLITDCKQSPLKILGGNNGRYTNFEWRRIGGTGPVFTGENNIFTNLTGESVGMDGNYPFPDTTYRGAGNGIVISGTRNILTKYHIANTAYNGISVTGEGNHVNQFIIDASCQRIRDGGAIYTSGSTADPSVSTNYDGMIMDGIIKNLPITAAEYTSEAAVGLYADNRTDNYRFENVTVEGGTYGAVANWNSRKTQFINCKFVGYTTRAILYRQDTDIADSPLFANNDGNISTGNIFAPRSNTVSVEARDRNNTTTFNPFSNSGESDNNHYVNPYGTNVAGYRQTEGGSITNYTLATWRTKMGEDAASTSRTNYITFSNATNALQEVKVELNETDEPVLFNVPVGYSDEEGNPFSNPVTIPAYGSLVYFKDSAA